MSDSTSIIVVADMPPAPMVLVPGSFVADLADAESTVAKLVINDQATAQAAAYLQQRLTKAGTALEKARTELKAPLLAAGRAIDTAAAGPETRIESMKRALKQRQMAYDTEQRRIAAELERARQAEIARLEKIRRDELERLEEQKRAQDAENKRIADELAKNAVAPKEDDLDLADDIPPPVEKTELEKKIDEIKYAPLPIAPAKVYAAPVGLTFRTTLKVTVTDVHQLPEAFVLREPNLKALRAVYTSPWTEGQPIPNCPGCTFEADRQPITR